MPSPAVLVDLKRDRIAELCARFDVPGMAVGLHVAGEEAVIGHGIASTVSGVETTPGTLFQIGSISKVYTASATMRFVDRGVLDLDAPIRTYLPGLRLADAEVADRLTARHLLNHTSGLEGDVFDDTGRGDDCIARYVDLLADVPQARPLGAAFSYCNSGWVLLGALLEELGAATWDRVLADEVLGPLGLRSTMTLPEQALAHRVAYGHQPDPHGSAVPTPVWTYPRAIGPAGLVISDVGDLLAFGRAHLADGTGRHGRWLGAGRAQEMREHQVDVPGSWPAPAWGLGWIRYDWDGVEVVGHDGGTLGQRALLRIVPGRDIAVAVLTNSSTGALAARRVVAELMAELDLAVPALPAAPVRPVDERAVRRHVGTYERRGERWDVTWRDDRLVAEAVIDVTDLVPPSRGTLELAPIDERRFLVSTRGEPDMVVTFAADSSWMFNGRMNDRRMGSARG